MGNFPQPVEKRLMATIRAMEARLKRLEHLAADPVAIGGQLARTSIASPNYEPGVAGWIFNADGTGDITESIDGAMTVVIGPTPPGNPHVGDLWFDYNNNFQMKQWDGAAWVPYQFGTNALAAGSVSADIIAANAIVAGMIAAGAIDGLTINGVTINGNMITSTDVVVSGINGGVFVYGSGAGGVLTFTSTGSWTAPPGVTTVTVELWGAGGGGGGNGGLRELISGAGGGAGQYVKYQYTVVPGNVYNFTIGAAGLGKPEGVDGTNGGFTYFDGTNCAADGGNGGESGNTGAHGGDGGQAIPPGSPVEVRNGGKGGNGVGDGPAGGGGGGGSGASGYPGLDGHPGVNPPNAAYGQGAAAVPGGGPGGRGGGAYNAPNDGQPPVIGPGGGGGGAGGDGNGSRSGANGWKGQLRLTWIPTTSLLTGSITGQAGVEPLGGQPIPEGAMFDKVTVTNTGSQALQAGASVLHSIAGHGKYASPDGSSYAVGRLTIENSTTFGLTTSMQTVTGLSAPLAIGQYHIRAQLLISNPGTAGQGVLNFRLHPTGGLTATAVRISLVQFQAAGTAQPYMAMPNALDTTVSTDAPGTGGTERMAFIDGIITVSVAGTLNVQMSQAATAACNVYQRGSYLEVMPMP